MPITIGVLALVLGAALWTSAPASAARLLGPVPRNLPGGTAVTPTPAAPTQLRAAPRAAPVAPPCTDAPGTSDFTGCYLTLNNQFLTDVAQQSATDGSTPMDDVYGVAAQYGANTPDTGRRYTFNAGAHAIVVNDAWPADATHGNTGGCQSSPGPHNTPYNWCLTDAQVQSELSSVLATRGWPSDLNSVYFMMLPSGIDECSGPYAEVRGSNPCADSDFCAYHSNFSDPLGTQVAPLYAVVPWPDVTGCRTPSSPRGNSAADSGINLISHEHIETVTDPLANGWYADGTGGVQDETGDKCIKTFSAPATGTTYNQLINNTGYFLQDEFANADGTNLSDACEGKPGGANDHTPNAATGNAPLSYHGGPTMHTVDAYTIYWDGHPGGNPTASIASAPATVHRGDAAGFQAATASDPQGQTPSYSWNFGDGNVAPGQTAGHTYQVSGTYTVTLTVSDPDGYQASDTRTVRVLAPPTASFTIFPASAPAGTPLDFNAAASADPDGSITSWLWAFGDGFNGIGQRVNHAYAHTGIYNATLTLVDSNGSSGSETVTVVVPARTAPGLSARGSPRTARSGAHVLLMVGRTLSCPPGATNCAVTLAVTTLRRLVAGTASRRHTVIRKVTIGSALLSVRPGTHATLQLQLNPTGQALLRRLRHLRLSVSILARATGAPTTSGRLSATVGYPPSPARRR